MVAGRPGNQSGCRQPQGQWVTARKPIDAVEIVALDAVLAQERLSVGARHVAKREAPEQPPHRRRPAGHRAFATGEHDPDAIAEGGHEGGPSHPRFRIKLSCLARHSRNPDQHMAGGTLNLPAGKLFATLQMLLAVRTRELEFAHTFLSGFGPNMHQNQARRNGLISGSSESRL
jgi:hypothetical protein